MTLRRARLPALVALPLMAAPPGCGTQDADAPARARDGRVAIALDDFFYAPQVVRAPRGALTVELANRGRLGHTFRLRREGRVYVKIPTLKPGERDSFTRELAPGGYRFFCAIANHEELGLYGTLQVGP